MTLRSLFLWFGWFAVALAGLPATADTPAACAPEAKELYFPCSSCHGPRGEGNEAFEAPALAGLDAPYIRRQLTLFRSDQRGFHPDDALGQQMTLLARGLRTPDSIAAVACYVATLPAPPPPVPTLKGDPRRGAKQYAQSCAACHGARAEGIEALGAPALGSLADWYVLAQLEAYRRGWRGTDPEDVAGQQMRAAASALTSARDARDIAVFLARRR